MKGLVEWLWYMDGAAAMARHFEAPVPEGRDVPIMQPPPIIAFGCPWLIEP